MQKVKIYIEHTVRPARKEKGAYIYNMVCIQKDGTESAPAEGMEILEYTTEMEITLKAATQAMKRITRPVDLEIYTGTRSFLYSYRLADMWERHDYIRSNNEKVKHAELWHTLLQLRDMGGHELEITYSEKTEYTNMLQSKLKRIMEEKENECSGVSTEPQEE